MEWSVTTTLFLLEDIDLSEEVLVRSDGARFCDNLATLYFLLVDTAEEKTYVISSLTLIKELADCLLYTSPSPRDRQKSRMPSSA